MKSLIVWARPGLPPRGSGYVVLWESFLPDDAPSEWISLPECVHRDRQELRTRYQSWISGVSERQINGLRVTELMSIRSNLSYWWMTLPTHNSLAIDSPAYQVIRLFALSSVTAGLDFDQVTVVTERPEVAHAIRLWAHKLDKAATVKICKPHRSQQGRQKRSRGPVLAMLRVFVNHLRIAAQPNREIGQSVNGDGIVFVDYLAHLQHPGLTSTFRSNYWGPLVGLVEGWPEPVNWLHIPAKFATPAVIQTDLAVCEGFNAIRPGHNVLHAYLDINTVCRAFRDYLRIRHSGKKLWRRSKVFVEANTGLDPTPLLLEFVRDMYFGRTAALNSIYINLWESVVDALPSQRLGVYLFENQPWELAFLSAWRRARFGRILAFPHSTMSHWDLRYFLADDFEELAGRPTADSVVVNGPLMRSMAVGGGYPESILLDAEALRSQTPLPNQEGGITDVLVLGEYEVAQDGQLMEIAESFVESFGPTANVVYRPHPTADTHTRLLPAHWKLSQHSSIYAAVAGCRVAICGPNSSAALDARVMGKSVVVIGMPNTLISGPALNFPNVYLVTTRSQALAAAEKILVDPVAKLDPEPLCTELEIPRWQQLLSESVAG